MCRYLRQNLSYVSDTEVCVLGRGYGAWLAAGLIAELKDQDIKCGVLVNPVARWQDTGQLPRWQDTGQLTSWQELCKLNR